jgi:hypothetical protein
VIRRAGQILAILIVVTCFLGLTTESRRACFRSTPAQRQLGDSTKIVECRAVDTVPHFQVIPYPALPPRVFFEALPRLEVHPPPVAFISPVYLFRPPPTR